MDILWEGNSNVHKFHLVKWDEVILPKRLGGLGINNSALHNKCLQMKCHGDAHEKSKAYGGNHNCQAWSTES